MGDVDIGRKGENLVKLKGGLLGRITKGSYREKRISIQLFGLKGRTSHIIEPDLGAHNNGGYRKKNNGGKEKEGGIKKKRGHNVGPIKEGGGHIFNINIICPPRGGGMNRTKQGGTYK